MPAPISIEVPRPTEIKRLPWMRRIHVYSPKLARMLALFSTESLKAWALIESCPLIEAFCEHPGYVQIDGRRALADFWVRGQGRQEFVKLEGGVDLQPEQPDQVRTFTDVVVDRVEPGWFTPYEQWIANWHQINPYLVANARFVPPAMLERVASLFNAPRPLYDLEHAMRDTDVQLARSAVLMLLHQGRLISDDLMLRPFASTTVFRPSAGRP